MVQHLLLRDWGHHRASLTNITLFRPAAVSCMGEPAPVLVSPWRAGCLQIMCVTVTMWVRVRSWPLSTLAWRELSFSRRQVSWPTGAPRDNSWPMRGKRGSWWDYPSAVTFIREQIEQGRSVEVRSLWNRYNPVLSRFCYKCIKLANSCFMNLFIFFLFWIT